MKGLPNLSYDSRNPANNEISTKLSGSRQFASTYDVTLLKHKFQQQQ